MKDLMIKFLTIVRLSINPVMFSYYMKFIHISILYVCEEGGISISCSVSWYSDPISMCYYIFMNPVNSCMANIRSAVSPNRGLEVCTGQNFRIPLCKIKNGC